MPSNSLTNNGSAPAEPGCLYVVATPIGNREDITLRALNILGAVDLIAAEDTRKTGRFLARYNIRQPLISYHEHNEHERTPELIAKLKQNTSMALVCNAGTPGISDPGYRLVQAAIAAGLKVVPVPGVSAATAALSVAGLPTDSFVFIGFAPRKKARRLQQLSELAAEPRTLIFYESPRRITTLLQELADTLGDRRAVLTREMTKMHEEFIRGRLSEIHQSLLDRPAIKGECTLLVTGANHSVSIDRSAIQAEIRNALESKSRHLSETVRKIAAKYGLSKNSVYQEALAIRTQMEEKRMRNGKSHIKVKEKN
jgi:16S rRNA (cytidine1402-2'-O)-methyltransferase